ncbi:MAG: hypothetical protein Q9226_007705 [Calogaya cf. arnoldii]
MSPSNKVFESKHFSYTFKYPYLSRTYHCKKGCKNCEPDFKESQRFHANQDGLTELADLLQQQMAKVDNSHQVFVSEEDDANQDDDSSRLWREMANLEGKTNGLIGEMKDLEERIKWAWYNQDQA